MQPNQPTQTPVTTSASIPKGPAVTSTPTRDPDLGDLTAGTVVAKRLSSPDFFNLDPVNPLIQLRWVNRKYDNGFRVSYHQSQGFVLARPQDVKNLPTCLVNSENHVVYGDSILMKLARRQYEGALLANHNDAIGRIERTGIANRNTSFVQEELANAPGTRAQKAKIQPFVPSGEELAAMMPPDASKPVNT